MFSDVCVCAFYTALKSWVDYRPGGGKAMQEKNCWVIMVPVTAGG